MRVLVTGFEPYDGQWNASQELIRSLRDAPLEWAPELSGFAHFHTLACDTRKAKAELAGLIAAVDPDYCLLTGQAPGRNKITLERFAQNLKDFGGPDAAGNKINGELIEAEGPVAYRSNLPLEALVQALSEAGIPAAPSNHAGNHLCNQALYHVLHYAAGSGHRVKATFVHVPLLPMQVQSQHPGAPFMTLDMLRDGIGVLLQQLVQSGASPFES